MVMCRISFLCNTTLAAGGTLTVEAEEPVLCFPQGDVNQDGKLTTGDARMVLQYCLTDVAFLQSDVNALADYDGNGKIETSDAREILIATLVA